MDQAIWLAETKGWGILIYPPWQALTVRELHKRQHFEIFFVFFQENKVVRFQTLFSEKYKKNIINLLSAKYAQRVLKVKYLANILIFVGIHHEIISTVILPFLLIQKGLVVNYWVYIIKIYALE